jgi:hypothetical protein
MVNGPSPTPSYLIPCWCEEQLPALGFMETHPFSINAETTTSPFHHGIYRQAQHTSSMAARGAGNEGARPPSQCTMPTTTSHSANANSSTARCNLQCSLDGRRCCRRARKARLSSASAVQQIAHQCTSYAAHHTPVRLPAPAPGPHHAAGPHLLRHCSLRAHFLGLQHIHCHRPQRPHTPPQLGRPVGGACLFRPISAATPAPPRPSSSPLITLIISLCSLAKLG